MSESRKEVLSKAFEAELGETSVDPGTMFTDDVVGWSPYVSVSGLQDMATRRAPGNGTFQPGHSFRGLDEVGNKAIAEWVVEADHTGPYWCSARIPCSSPPGSASRWPASP